MTSAERTVLHYLADALLAAEAKHKQLLEICRPEPDNSEAYKTVWAMWFKDLSQVQVWKDSQR
jgi:hypothetical protein